MAQEYSYFAGEQPQRQRPLPPPPPFARTPTSTVHEGQGTLYETGESPRLYMQRQVNHALAGLGVQR